MGVEMNTQDSGDETYTDKSNRFFEILVLRQMNIFYRNKLIYKYSALKKEFDEMVKNEIDFTNKVIAERKAYLKKLNSSSEQPTDVTVTGGKIRRSLLDTMLAAEKEGLVTEREVREEVTAFISAGFDTTAFSTSMTLFLIAAYPHIQEQVVAELEDVFGDSGRVPDMQDLSNLKVLERCIKESMRIYPPATAFERYINQDVQCEQYLIPSGSCVIFSPYIVHHDPEFWPDPEKFDPDRFLPENCVGRHPCAYIPFSMGHRNCIGQKFAMIEEKVVLSTILRRFRVEAACPRENLKIEAGVAMRCEGGMHARFFERHNKPNLRVSV